jgi:hypothetical protein
MFVKRPEVVCKCAVILAHVMCVGEAKFQRSAFFDAWTCVFHREEDGWVDACFFAKNFSKVCLSGLLQVSDALVFGEGAQHQLVDAFEECNGLCVFVCIVCCELGKANC